VAGKWAYYIHNLQATAPEGKMSAHLYTLRIDLPGLWTDGWLYKDHLILWSRSGQIHITPLSKLASAVSKELAYPPLEAVAEYLIFRNDWKASEQFDRLKRIPGIESSFIAEFGRGSEGTVVPIDGVDYVPVPTDQVPGVILDTAIYANRVYVGSTDGLFETRFDPDLPGGRHPLVPQLADRRIGSVNAWYSAINSSAGEDGLWFSRMSFDELGRWWNQKSGFHRVAEFSRDNSFADVNLLNYTDDAFPVFMHSQTTKEKSTGNPEPDRRKSDRRQITGYGGTTAINDLMESFLRGRRRPPHRDTLFTDGLNDDTVAVLGNSGNRMLLNWDNSLRVLDLTLDKDQYLSVKRDSSFQNVSGIPINPLDILYTYTFSKGFLVELPDEVRLINSQGSFSLLAEPVAQIRTFPRSRRHREVILLIREEGASLLGFYISQGPNLNPR
jgi:hypothetical protein